MPRVKISEDALTEIMRRVVESRASRQGKDNDIPLLIWSHRTYTDNSSGNRKELGPMFFLSWTNEDEIEQNGYLTTSVTGKPSTLAIAPGTLFSSEKKRIVLENNHLIAVDD